MSEDTEIRGIIPNYYSLIIDKLNRIYEAWDNNDTITALNRALKLVTFMPRKIKKELADERTRIMTRMQTVENIRGYDYQATRLRCQQQMKKISSSEIEPFVDKITNLLDENKLLTQGYGVPTRSKSMQDLQMTIDRAKFEKEKSGSA